MQLENYGSALADADQCIQVKSDFIKGYYRKSSALIALGKPKEARDALIYAQNSLKITNQDINERLKQLTAYIREQQFYECIQKEDEIDQLWAKVLTADKNYKGPTLEIDQPINLEWVKTLLDYLKDSKKLDKKYLWILIRRAKDIMDKESNVEYI